MWQVIFVILSVQCLGSSFGNSVVAADLDVSLNEKSVEPQFPRTPQADDEVYLVKEERSASSVKRGYGYNDAGHHQGYHSGSHFHVAPGITIGFGSHTHGNKKRPYRKKPGRYGTYGNQGYGNQGHYGNQGNYGNPGPYVNQGYHGNQGHHGNHGHYGSHGHSGHQGYHGNQIHHGNQHGAYRPVHTHGQSSGEYGHYGKRRPHGPSQNYGPHTGIYGHQGHRPNRFQGHKNSYHGHGGRVHIERHHDDDGHRGYGKKRKHHDYYGSRDRSALSFDEPVMDTFEDPVHRASIIEQIPSLYPLADLARVSQPPALPYTVPYRMSYFRSGDLQADSSEEQQPMAYFGRSSVLESQESEES